MGITLSRIKKLEVINESGLLNLRSIDTTELVNNSYTMGLFKLGEYSIYEFLLTMFNLDHNPIIYLNKYNKIKEDIY